MVTQYDATNGLPSIRTTIEDDNVDFSFLRRQLFTSDQAKALEREILLRLVRSAENVFLATNRFRE